MPRPRKPYVQREISRHGVVVWYFRRGAGPRIRLQGAYESAEWLRDYERALGIAAGQPEASPASKGTLGWLIDRYLVSVAFTAQIQSGTQRARRSVLLRVKATGGNILLSKITRKVVAEGRDSRSATPTAAVNYVKIVKAMFKWAVGAGIMESNPADGVDHKAIRTDGHHTWTVDEVRQFQRHFPLGTRERLAMDILLFTGMRGSDAVLFGRQHVRDGIVRYRSVKTKVDVEMPLLAPLKASLDATAVGDLTFLLTEFGRPFTSAASFGNWFRKACKAAGVPGRAHGLRKAGATIAAENGASDLQLMAMWGWLTPAQAGVYTRRANRGKLAAAAGQKLLEGQGENDLSPHLYSGAGAGGEMP